MPSHKTLFTAPIIALSILAGATLFLEDAMAREETHGKLIATFTLTPDSPARVFFEGNLNVELVSATADDLMKTIKIRVSSRALKAEYGDLWKEHTYLEMLKHYVRSPISGSPFKCAEGWLYYEHSGDGGVTLSLRTNPHMTGSFSYNVLVLTLENWKKVVIGLGVVAVAILLYYYIPILWSFVSIQHLAHAHALKTGFPSSPVIIYLIKRLPLLMAFCFLFYVFFNYGWKGVAAAAAIGISLQLYLNRHNAEQLRTYASLKNMTPIAESKNRAFQGQVNGRPVALAVGGTFIKNPSYAGDYESGGPYFHMSYLVLEVAVSNAQWDGLVLLRDIAKPDTWSSSLPVDRFPRVGEALAAISRLSKYSILRLEVRNNKLMAMKMFAPDTPAEINLLVDLVEDVTSALDQSKR